MQCAAVHHVGPMEEKTCFAAMTQGDAVHVLSAFGTLCRVVHPAHTVS